MWIRRLKTILLLVAAAVICVRGVTYTDPSGSGLIPVVMCALMGLALMMLGFGVATKSSDPLFI